MDETFQQIDRRFERVDEELAALRHAIKNEDKARAALRCRSRENDRERNLVLDQSLATARQVIEVMASNAADDVMFERRLTITIDASTLSSRRAAASLRGRWHDREICVR